MKIKAIQSNVPSMFEFVNLIKDAKLLVSQFATVEFSHIKRQGNSVAHNIARHVSEFVMWMEDIPPHLSVVILVKSAIPT